MLPFSCVTVEISQLPLACVRIPLFLLSCLTSSLPRNKLTQACNYNKILTSYMMHLFSTLAVHQNHLWSFFKNLDAESLPPYILNQNLQACGWVGGSVFYNSSGDSDVQPGLRTIDLLPLALRNKSLKGSD